MNKILDMIIAGSGPAGMAAAIYASRAELDFIVLERSSVSGGQVLTTYEVDNYPGIPHISGGELSVRFREHCEALKASFVTAEIESVTKREDSVFEVRTDSGECYLAKTFIACTGAMHSMLGCKGEEELTGMGVSYCATCDGAFFKGADVAVVGGGDVAVEDAIYLSRICRKVYLIHRRNEFRAAKSLVSRAIAIDNIEFVTDSVVTEIKGEDMVEEVLVQNKLSGELSSLKVSGIFIAVGIVPATDLYKGLVDMNENGYIIAGENCTSSLPGFYAAGDLRTKALRQIITAASDGAVAVSEAVRYLG